MATTHTTVVPHLQNMIQGDRLIFSMSDDKVMKTHAPDGQEVDVKTLLSVVEVILGFQADTSQAQMEAFSEMTTSKKFASMLEGLAYTIHNIHSEIQCKCSGGGDVNETTLSLLTTLSSYAWDAKVVVALAAFGVNYREIMLVSKHYPTDKLAKYIALLKQVPDTSEKNESARIEFDAIIRQLLQVTKDIVQLHELHAQYNNQETTVMATALRCISFAVYWTIRTIVVCSQQLVNVIGLELEYRTSTTENWELSDSAESLNIMHSQLKKQLELWNRQIDEKRRSSEAYQKLGRLFETVHLDSIKILRAFFYAHDNTLPLYHCSTKNKIDLETLRRKNILLLISDLDISVNEISKLAGNFNEFSPTGSVYEMVWVPVVERSTPWTKEQKTKFEGLQKKMQCYTVASEYMLDPAVIKYIKEKWEFSKAPILVVLDPRGRVVNKNALQMMLMWGSSAFPFTSAKEYSLCRNEDWRIEKLFRVFGPEITAKKCICLYGGEDMDWIRKFTVAVRKFSKEIQLPIELVYVGKSNPNEQVSKNIASITSEGLHDACPDLASMKYFWTLLPIVWDSNLLHGKTIGNDPIMEDIMAMLSFDRVGQSWAVLSSESKVAKANGDTMLNAFTESKQWKQNVKPKGLVPALISHLRRLQASHHCESQTETLVCTECGCATYIGYRCRAESHRQDNSTDVDKPVKSNDGHANGETNLEGLCQPPSQVPFILGFSNPATSKL